MPAEFLEEMKRYVRFGPDDESALRALAPHAAPHFRRIADEVYQRLQEHEEARKVLGMVLVAAGLICSRASASRRGVILAIAAP